MKRIIRAACPPLSYTIGAFNRPQSVMICKHDLALSSVSTLMVVLQYDSKFRTDRLNWHSKLSDLIENPTPSVALSSFTTYTVTKYFIKNN